MNNNTHEINTTKIQKSRLQAPNLSALRMRQVITNTPNPSITICSNRRIESRKLNWKAESKLDTKNSEYIKMLGQSVEEGLDKKAKVGLYGILKVSLLNIKSDLTVLFIVIQVWDIVIYDLSFEPFAHHVINVLLPA